MNYALSHLVERIGSMVRTESNPNAKEKWSFIKEHKNQTHTAYEELRYVKWKANWNNRKPRFVKASKEPR